MTLNDFIAKHPAPYRSPWQLRPCDGEARMRVGRCDLHVFPERDVAFVDSPNSTTENRDDAPADLPLIERIGWFFARIIDQERGDIDLDMIPEWARDATISAIDARLTERAANLNDAKTHLEWSKP